MSNEQGPAKKEKFLNILKKETVSTGKLYLSIVKDPSLLAKGVYQVIKDVTYELPKSIIENRKGVDLEKKLNETASQSLTLSELATIPGTYGGVALFKMFGADDYTASVIGGNIGNYISGASSYILAYAVLTRGNKNYSVKNALRDSFEVVKDCFPIAIATYLADAPIMSGLLATGMSRNLAIGLNLGIGMIAFTGVAKNSATENIKSAEKELKEQ